MRGGGAKSKPAAAESHLKDDCGFQGSEKRERSLRWGEELPFGGKRTVKENGNEAPASERPEPEGLSALMQWQQAKGND